MPEPIVTLDEGSLRADLRELIRKPVSGSIAEVLPEGGPLAPRRPLLQERAGEGAEDAGARRSLRCSEAIHAGESREVSERKAADVADESESIRARGGREGRRDGCAETLTYTGFPAAPLQEGSARTTPSSRLNREIPQADPRRGGVPLRTPPPCSLPHG